MQATWGDDCNELGPARLCACRSWVLGVGGTEGLGLSGLPRLRDGLNRE